MNWVFDRSMNERPSDWYFTALGGTSYYPRTLVIDQNGIISYTVDGALSYDELKGEITRLLPDEDTSEIEEAKDSDFIIIFDVALTVILAISVFLSIIYFGIVRKPKKEKNRK